MYFFGNKVLLRMRESKKLTKTKRNDLYNQFCSKLRSFGIARALGQELSQEISLQRKNRILTLKKISRIKNIISKDTHWCLSSDLFLRIPLLGWWDSSSMFNNFPLTTTLSLWPSFLSTLSFLVLTLRGMQDIPRDCAGPNNKCLLPSAPWPNNKCLLWPFMRPCRI